MDFRDDSQNRISDIVRMVTRGSGYARITSAHKIEVQSRTEGVKEMGRTPIVRTARPMKAAMNKKLRR